MFDTTIPGLPSLNYIGCSQSGDLEPGCLYQPCRARKRVKDATSEHVESTRKAKHTIPEGYVNLFSTSGVKFCAVAKRATERRPKASLDAAQEEDNMVGRRKEKYGQESPLSVKSCMPSSKPSHDVCTIDQYEKIVLFGWH